MQAGLGVSDRVILIATGVLLSVVLAATALLAPQTAEESEAGVPSTYSATKSGARAAFLLLQDLHYPVQRWEESPQQLVTRSENSLLILAEPTEVPSPQERLWLAKFVNRGGRVLFCGPSVHSFFRSAPAISAAFSYQSTYAALLPSLFTSGAPQVTFRTQGVWSTEPGVQIPLYGVDNQAVVALWRRGRGEILWWTSATPLTNSGITQSDNLTLFLNTLSRYDSQVPLTIYWDEYFHGEGHSLWEDVKHSAAIWAIMQSALIALAVLFTFSRRWGPIQLLVPPARVSPLEFVDTLGGLYRRARATPTAVLVVYQTLRSRLTRRLAVSPDIDNSALAAAANARLGWPLAELAQSLQNASDRSASQTLSQKEGLSLIQQMANYLGQLNRFQKTEGKRRI